MSQQESLGYAIAAKLHQARLLAALTEITKSATHSASFSEGMRLIHTVSITNLDDEQASKLLVEAWFAEQELYEEGLAKWNAEAYSAVALLYKSSIAVLVSYIQEMQWKPF